MEKNNKEYPILSNWKFVFKEMYDLDHKYPWYIAVRSVAGFLAPFIAAIIPSAAMSMVEKKADLMEAPILKEIQRLKKEAGKYAQ